MRVTSIQMEIKDRPKKKNLEAALDLLDQAPQSDLILLPELWPCGYFSFHRYLSDSEPVDGPTVSALRKKASALGVHILMGSLVLREDDNLFNAAVLLGPDGGIMAQYRKIHLFGYQSEERILLKAGEKPVVVDLPWGKAGITTCYDLRFPELYRMMVDQGASFFLVPSAWPLARLDAWRLFNRARAHENLSYLFSCNCAGKGEGKAFAGHSMIVDPGGEVLAEGGEDVCYVSAEIDPDRVNIVRREFSALNDRVF
jgi:predicted amidohydrolase